MPELFLEIGTEEIPSGFIEPALIYVEKELQAFFEKNRITASGSRYLGTPRRLVVAFDQVEDRQRDVVETYLGPNIKAAYDAEGNPTKAAIGFARGKGLDVSALTTENTPKGEVVCARVEKIGQPTSDILNQYLPDLLIGIPFPKKMRWENKKVPFVRPMHWIVALFGGEILNFEFDGIRCGDESQGHRFLAPTRFNVKDIESYLKKASGHFLVVDPDERKKLIQEQLATLAGEVGGHIREDERLLNEVNYLVEYPQAIRGDFGAHYLELPEELLIMTMKQHQRYFPVFGKEGGLLPHFITISNMKTEGDEIRHGNERVIRARLEDARFFYDEDRKSRLEDFVESLKGVVFQKSLGTSYEKTVRIESLAGYIAGKVCPQQKTLAVRAAYLCKADLVTQMVYEFPELQGVMGGYYARHSGEATEVALAIKEHYSPAFAGDAPPTSLAGAVVAISDKLDTILGCIGVGLIPSGSEDPYGLRRHSLGIIQIILEKNWQVSLDEMIDFGIKQLQPKIKLTPDEIRNHTIDLFSLRFKSLLSGEGFSYDAIDAVLSTGIDSPVDVRHKTVAFSELKEQPHFEPLATAFRRVVSILNEESPGEVQADLLTEPAEIKLYEEYRRLAGPVEDTLSQKEYSRALEQIVEIKGAVDDFFDKVMVMVEDDAVRKNRLHLLYKISRLFANIADFSKIVLKKS